MKCPPKAEDRDVLGRFREVISDPINLLIEREPLAGVLDSGLVTLHNGNRVPAQGPGAYYGPFSQLLIVNRGVHEPLEEYVFQELLTTLPDAPQMIELGAYWAHYSMWLKKRRPQAKVIMLEPDPKNLEVGRANFQRNGFEGEFIHATVAQDAWNLDPFMQSRGLAHLDILHADIQGFEMHLIAGGRETPRSHAVDYVFISTHSQELHHRVVKLMTKYGYRVEVESDFDAETTSYDGLMFASSPRARPIFEGFPSFGRTQIAGSRSEEILKALSRARESRVRV